MELRDVAVRSCFVHLLFCSNRSKFAKVPPEQVPAPSLLRLRRRLLPFTKPWVAMPVNLPYYYCFYGQGDHASQIHPITTVYEGGDFLIGGNMGGFKKKAVIL